MSYSNNYEYRALIRSYFLMNISSSEREQHYIKDSDPESYDELLYDDDAMKKGMDAILEKTRNNPLYITLYTLAAGQFLTDDIETGLCVLLSYDYFADFIKIYENDTLTEMNEDYITLNRKIS